MTIKNQKQNNELTILIVEDDGDLNGAYSMILSSAGYHILSAYNGREALDIIEREGDPDIIFLDLRMPVLDGIGFLEKYKANSHDTTVIVFSNYDAQSEVDKAFELGADRYVLKARAAPKELIHIVEEVAAQPTKKSKN